jgi:tetratricopeptide (TPR) repeat protein
MKRLNHVQVAIVLVTAILFAGCHGDPKIRKQKYMDSGERYSAEGRYREATIQFLNALKVDDNFAEAHYALAQAYAHLGQFGPACEQLERTVDIQPSNSRARLDLGNLMFARGRSDEAQIQATAVLATNANDADAHALLSTVASQQGQSDKAFAEIRRAIVLDPARGEFYDALALLEAADPAQASAAESDMKKAISLAPKSLNAKLLLAAYYQRANRLFEAEKIGWSAVATDPRSLTARANVAEVILREGAKDRAEQVVQQAARDFGNDPSKARILADYYAASSQLEKARAEFARLTAKYPKDISLQKGYARVLIRMGDFAGARTLLTNITKKDLNDPEVTALNGILLFKSGNAAGGVNSLLDAVRRLPNDAFIQYWLGKAAQAKGDSDLEETSFRHAAEIDPSNLDVERELARIASQRGEMDLLDSVAQRTVSTLPHLADGYVWRAIVEVDRNQLNQAESDLATALRNDPQCWQAYLEFGKVRLMQKRFADGVSMLEHALDANPASIDALRLLASYDLAQHKPDQAIARVNRQIGKVPQDSRLYDLLAGLEIQTKDMKLAAIAAQKAIQLNAADGEAVELFAQIAISQGQIASAISAWQHWLQDHPTDANALAVLGTLEESSGNLNKAETYYRQALQIQPQQPVAANNLAYRMLENGEQVDVALSLAQIARQAMPNSPITADTLAWAFYHKSAYQYARDLLEGATEVMPDNANMQYHLGMVYSKLHDKRNASVHLKKALSQANDPHTIRDTKAALQGLS